MSKTIRKVIAFAVFAAMMLMMVPSAFAAMIVDVKATINSIPAYNQQLTANVEWPDPVAKTALKVTMDLANYKAMWTSDGRFDKLYPVALHFDAANVTDISGKNALVTIVKNGQVIAAPTTVTVNAQGQVFAWVPAVAGIYTVQAIAYGTANTVSASGQVEMVNSGSSTGVMKIGNLNMIGPDVEKFNMSKLGDNLYQITTGADASADLTLGLDFSITDNDGKAITGGHIVTLYTGYTLVNGVPTASAGLNPQPRNVSTSTMNGVGHVYAPYTKAMQSAMKSPASVPVLIEVVPVTDLSSKTYIAATFIYVKGTISDTVVTATPDFVYVDSGKTQTVSVAVNKPGLTLAVASNKPDVATATVAGNIVTITGVKYGQALIKITAGSGAAYVTVSVDGYTTEKTTVAPTTAPTTSGWNTYRVVNVNTRLNVRTTPSTSGKRLGYLYAGDEIQGQIIPGSAWIKVDYNGKTGYTSGKYLAQQ